MESKDLLHPAYIIGFVIIAVSLLCIVGQAIQCARRNCRRSTQQDSSISMDALMDQPDNHQPDNQTSSNSLDPDDFLVDVEAPHHVEFA